MARTGLFYLFSMETSKYNVVSCFLLTVFKVLVRAGDYKCESACGADPRCDEKGIYEQCGNNGRCTENCQCCEIYDTDGGKNYLVKGTTQGLSRDGSSCINANDYCQTSSLLVEYYVEEIGKVLSYETYNCSQRTDGNIRCVDGHCGCLSDDDCKKFNPLSFCDDTTKTCKIGCKSEKDCLEYAKNNCNGYLAKCVNNQCICKTECKNTSECLDNYFCIYDIDGKTAQCVNKTTVINYEGKSYLCDPPHWNLKNSENEKSFLEKLLEKIKELIYPLFPILKK